MRFVFDEIQSNSIAGAPMPPDLSYGERVLERRQRAQPTSISEITAYYDSKTAAIIKRYGPGPRVHYHTGMIDELPQGERSAADLRRELTGSQERILYYAADRWKAGLHLRGDVLDVGCGLGGGSIFWAHEYGATVTALTCVPAHAPVVASFAAQAGVAAQVRPLVCDAHEAPGENRFDAAVAVDSSCHLERTRWFRRMARLLRPGGHLFILDCFLGWPECEAIFNQHWWARIGTVQEYLAAAGAAGLRLDLIQDLSSRTQGFWSMTLALLRAEAREDGAHLLSPAAAARSGESFRAHAFMQHHLGNQGLQYALLSFSKER